MEDHRRAPEKMSSKGPVTLGERKRGCRRETAALSGFRASASPISPAMRATVPEPGELVTPGLGAKVVLRAKRRRGVVLLPAARMQEGVPPRPARDVTSLLSNCAWGCAATASGSVSTSSEPPKDSEGGGSCRTCISW